MILVDTSVWIDLLGRTPSRRLDLEQRHLVVTCPPVIQEVLQGVREEVAHARARRGLLALPRLGDPVGMDAHLAAADLYRFARRKGVTIRSGVDCLIAAIAMAGGATVWHLDRDFEQLARITDLRAHCRATPV